MPTLNWNEIRTRAAAFAKDWANEDSERAEAQSFWNEFFEVFGVKRRRVAVFEKQVVKLPNGGKTAHGRIDVSIPDFNSAMRAQLLVCCERANPSAPTVSRHLGEHPALRTDQTIRPA